MVLSGMAEKILFFVAYGAYQSCSEEDYQHFITNYGTLLGVFQQISHSHSYSICLIISIHRLSIVINPKNQFFFGPAHLWLYSLLANFPLISLVLLPYYSDCPVYYGYEKMKAIALCTPVEHTLTSLLNKSCLTISIVSLVINFAIFLHGRFKTDGTYVRCADKMGIKSKILEHNMSMLMVDAVSPAILIMRKRRHRAIRELGMSISALLFAYEIGELLIRALNDHINQNKRDIAPFMIHLFLMFHNVIAYFAATEVSRVVVRNLFGLVGVYGIHNSNIIYVT
uniref:Uncharacterized protein n=1 Tax=Caenorhabditis japonica TaxID=281687 RepID=A0A8R1IG18_CAEJA